MRLIDADKLILYLNDYALQASPFRGERAEAYNAIKQCIEAVEEQPTDYDIDKVVEELEERQKEYLAGFGVHNNDEMYGVACGLGDAIKIVKQGCAYDDDVCEWHCDYEFVSDKYKRETGCGYTFYDLHHAVPFKFCPYCGKKIKVVE